MSLSKQGYPKESLIRAVWDCCDDLYIQLNRPPTNWESLYALWGIRARASWRQGYCGER